MPNTVTITIWLPPEMLENIERVRKKERRTRSELMGEALRIYLDRARALPTYGAAPTELRAIANGRQEIARGDYADAFAQLKGNFRRRNAPDRSRRPARGKNVYERGMSRKRRA